MPSTEPAGAALERWLRATFGELPALELGPLVELGPSAWASPGVTLPLPIVPAFRAEPPDDYALAGHWGRGGASEAVYVIERRGPHRTFLRLPWGGAYGEAAMDAARIREALSAWVTFRRVAPARLAGSEVVSNMQIDRAELRWPDGRALEILGPTPLHPERAPFWEALLGAVA